MIHVSNMLAVAAAALVMVLAGLQRRALERRDLRTCPACGRRRRACRCVR